MLQFRFVGFHDDAINYYVIMIVKWKRSLGVICRDQRFSVEIPAKARLAAKISAETVTKFEN